MSSRTCLRAFAPKPLQEGETVSFRKCGEVRACHGGGQERHLCCAGHGSLFISFCKDMQESAKLTIHKTFI